MMHTPIPWQLGHDAFRIEPYNAPRYELNDGWIISTCHGPDKQANAAHIVHCVNTYPALVEALEIVIQDWNEEGKVYLNTIANVRQTLALARKERS